MHVLTLTRYTKTSELQAGVRRLITARIGHMSIHIHTYRVVIEMNIKHTEHLKTLA